MSSTTTTAPSQAQPAFLRLIRVCNALVLPLAGTRLLPLYGVLIHRGRRSGRLFRTPVVVRAHADGFIVPMPWGERTDWCRNIRAAGGCVVRWKGRDYAMTDPQVLDARSVPSAFSGFQFRMMQRLNINQVLRLRPAT
jgi:deazaflavin-dependent oxidoreductase (nitroreductase family)